jgi:hypothetical protein
MASSIAPCTSTRPLPASPSASARRPSERCRYAT